MVRITKQALIETLDAVLQQQFFTNDGQILDRGKKESIKITGTRFTYIRIRNTIIDGFHFILGERMDKFIEYLSEKFQVPSDVFSKKLNELEKQMIKVDTRMKFMMIISAMREYWQDFAYQQVINELLQILNNIGSEVEIPSVEILKELISEKFASIFSLLVNLYVLKEMGKLAGTSPKIDDMCYQIMDHLASEIMVKIIEKDFI
ncbi:MAG: hypothetical protein ACTSWN_13840 [Promethearchaeota archaeon]